MKIYTVIDTNVIISALLSRHPDAATVKILDNLFDRTIIPIYNDEILEEYGSVLRRPKFNFAEETICGAPVGYPWFCGAGLMSILS